MLKKFLLPFCFLLAAEAVAYASPLYKAEDGIEFDYRWLDTRKYRTNRFALDGMHSVGPHQFKYDFEHSFGTDTLTKIGASYAYKKGFNWVGFGISSASNAPFTRLNLVDFEVFYAFRVFQNTTQYAEYKDGLRKAYYTRLYIGIDFSTERILLDGYPLPIIRYEYNLPTLRLIVGFPLTYIKIKTLGYQSFELKYIPVMNLLVGYNFGFDKHNTLSLYFEMENKKYRMSSTRADVYYGSQLKYYTELTMLKLQYSFSFADIATISPYAAFIIDGRRYWGKSIEVKNKEYMGIGYAAGLHLQIKF